MHPPDVVVRQAPAVCPQCQAPILTGWVGGLRALPLTLLSGDALAERALAAQTGALAGALAVPRAALEARLAAYHTHNWSADLLVRGADSYVRMGGLDAPARLAAPIAQPLYFAGEATHAAGNTGTVHGALATGAAAGRVLERLRATASS